MCCLRQVFILSLFIVVLQQTITVVPAAAKSRENNAAALKLTACKPEGYDQPARCGTYEVLENRAAKTGRIIPLSIVVVPAVSRHRRPDPVFYISGGPGQGAARIASGGEDNLMHELRKTRDLVLIDQRGTGDSNPLDCNFEGEPRLVQSRFKNLFAADRVRECRAQLEKKADLRYYTTALAMEDLDDIRRALGYEKINLYGISYGSLAALQYLRQYPRNVRALAIAGVATPAAKLPLHFAKSAEYALEKLFEDCREDAACHEAFADFRADFAKALKQLDEKPAKFKLPHAETKELQPVTLTREVFTERVRMMLYDNAPAALLPLVINRAAQGDWVPFGRVSRGAPVSHIYHLSLGMYLTVTCSESVPFITDADIERETAGTFTGAFRARHHQEACRQWPRGDIPDGYLEPVKSDVPVLMLSGEVDAATPPALGKAAATTLKNARQVILRNASHSYSSDCARGLVAAFIAAGDARNLDVGCAAQLRRPPFAVKLPARYTK